MRKVLARFTFLGLLGGAAFAVVRKRGGAGEVWHQANDLADDSPAIHTATPVVVSDPND